MMPQAQRRITRPTNSIERDARAALAPITFHLKPAEAAVDALAYRRRGLSGAAIAFHSEGPCFRLGAIGFSGRLYSPFAGVLSLHPRELDASAPDELPGFGRCHAGIEAAFAHTGNATTFAVPIWQNPRAAAHVQSVFDHNQSSRDHRAIPSREPVCQ
jgi:hypothetical protein